jgi:hypothetical protein
MKLGRTTSFDAVAEIETVIDIISSVAHDGVGQVSKYICCLDFSISYRRREHVRCTLNSSVTVIGSRSSSRENQFIVGVISA